MEKEKNSGYDEKRAYDHAEGAQKIPETEEAGDGAGLSGEQEMDQAIQDEETRQEREEEK